MPCLLRELGFYPFARMAKKISAIERGEGNHLEMAQLGGLDPMPR